MLKEGGSEDGEMSIVMAVVMLALTEKFGNSRIAWLFRQS